jgi:hypothetical protein
MVRRYAALVAAGLALAGCGLGAAAAYLAAAGGGGTQGASPPPVAEITGPREGSNLVRIAFELRDPGAGIPVVGTVGPRVRIFPEYFQLADPNLMEGAGWKLMTEAPVEGSSGTRGLPLAQLPQFAETG